MFVIDINYKVALDKIDEHLQDHVDFLNAQYKLGNFDVSGRKEPRVGGVILSTLADKEKLLKILDMDPFKKHDLADYRLIEFVPTKTSEELKSLLK